MLKNHLRTHEKRYPCNECGKYFRTNVDLKIHMRSHTNERPYVCEVEVIFFFLKIFLFSFSFFLKKNFSFQNCGKAFKTSSAVVNHRAIHSSIKAFHCSHCSYKGATKANLKIHFRRHTGIKAYECEYCSFKFSTASNKQKHIRNIHKGLKTQQVI